MKHGKYIGPIKELVGKTALIRDCPEGYLLQFDEMWLLHPVTLNILSHDWHIFIKEHVEILPEPEIDW